MVPKLWWQNDGLIYLFYLISYLDMETKHPIDGRLIITNLFFPLCFVMVVFFACFRFILLFIYLLLFQLIRLSSHGSSQNSD